jgi:folate-binding protein YgfZ
MNPPDDVCLLEDLGVLRFRGPDAAKFLQGQLSNDTSALTADTLLRAGLHNPQGRTLALLALARLEADDILALLPRELVDPISTHLKRYLLRSKLTLSDATADYRVLGLATHDAAGTLAGVRIGYGAPPPDPRAVLIQSVLDAAPAAGPPSAGAPAAVASPAVVSPAAAPPVSAARAHWHALDIAAGLPQVYPATSAQFVAQMLNLDCINAISFTKGCYTGQEVIARAHYRGRIKRRMQRFLSESPLKLQPAAAGRLDDGRSFRVVDAVTRSDGRCEFLAIAPTTAGAAESDDGAEAPTSSGVPAGGSIAASALPLPYPLPQ